MRGFRSHLRFVASLLALALLVFTASNPVRAQVALVGGGTFNGGAVTGATSFLDGVNFSLKNTADTTKVVQFSASGVTTGNTVTPLTFGGTTAAPTVSFPAGTASLPSLFFNGDTQTGLYARASTVLDVATAGGAHSEFHQNEGFNVNSAQGTAPGIGFIPSIGSSHDAFFMRDGVAAIQMGLDVNGPPVNQTLKAHDGITGADVKGASLTLAPGIGTGAGVSNPLTLNRVVTKATGTTAQTYAPAVVMCPTKILSNTSATVQTVATITTTSTTGGSVTMDYTVVANNGTLQDVDGGLVKVGWNNNAGTVAAAMTAVSMQLDSDASGTLAATPTQTVATNVVSIKLAPTWVTIVPTTVTAILTFTLGTTGDTVACQ